MALFWEWRYYEERKLSFGGQISEEVFSDFRSDPVNIKISGLGIDLRVGETKIVNGVWEIYPFGASHLTTSSDPGAGGNSVIYSHNKKDFFGPLLRIKKGDLIELRNAMGEEFKYKVESVVETNANDISYVLPKDTETLTLYTCSGPFDRKRFVVIAKPL